jgi:hypothetical protein
MARASVEEAERGEAAQDVVRHQAERADPTERGFLGDVHEELTARAEARRRDNHVSSGAPGTEPHR